MLQVSFPLVLQGADLGSANPNMQFHLSSVVVHTGGTASQGHYFTCARQANGTWLLHDDGKPTVAMHFDGVKGCAFGGRHNASSAYLLAYVCHMGQPQLAAPTGGAPPQPPHIVPLGLGAHMPPGAQAQISPGPNKSRATLWRGAKGGKDVQWSRSAESAVQNAKRGDRSAESAVQYAKRRRQAKTK